MKRFTLLSFLFLAELVAAENLVPTRLWEQCLRRNMPGTVVSAIYGSCAGQKCNDLAAGKFWEHCLHADEKFLRVVKKLYGDQSAEKCEGIMKVVESSLKGLSACDSNPCLNEGYCSPNGKSAYKCACRQAFSGLNCESSVVVCDPNPCFNDGYCEASEADGQFTCKCRMGFSGEKCKNVISVCSPNPCKNGGYCQQNGTNSYSCSCYPGFGGLNCETEIGACVSNPCKNNGFCIENGPTNFNCICQNGYSGEKCEDFRSPCYSSPCQNGGFCAERRTNTNGFVCNCPYEFSGSVCDIPTTPGVNCALLFDGDYEDSSVCPSESFFRCKDHKGWLQKCEDGKFFSRERAACTFRWNIRC